MISKSELDSRIKFLEQAIEIIPEAIHKLQEQINSLVSFAETTSDQIQHIRREIRIRSGNITLN